MEYESVYNILYKLLPFPKDVIKSIIFKNLVNSRKYVYKYTIACDALLNSVHLNKQLGIMCCRSEDECKLFDYKTGSIHDNSLIDTQRFKSYFDSHSKLIHFESEKLISRQNYVLSNYNIQDNKYVRITHDTQYEYYNSIIYVHGDYMYVLTNRDGRGYNLYKRDLNMVYICGTSQHSFDSSPLHISIFDGIIYICNIFDDDIDIHTYDINTLKKINSYCHPRIDINKCVDINDCVDKTTYQNKLYVYFYRNHVMNEISVYDLSTMNYIYSIKLSHHEMNTQYSRGSKLTINNDILMLSHGTRTIFYDIV
jgi:hypothetical protein